MTQNKVIPVKYFYYGMLGCVVFIAAVFFILWQKESKEAKLLNEKGIIGDAWVKNLSVSKASRKSSSNYFMEVAFFADTIASANNKNDSVATSPKNSDELIKSIAKIGEAATKQIGDYKTAQIPINYKEYLEYHINDKIKIKYVKDDPTIAKLVRTIN
jgi:hypothetical protein